MLDLKAKLLAAGLVTAEQVQRVKDDEQRKEQQGRERQQQRMEQGRDDRGPPRDDRGPPRDDRGPRGDNRGPPRGDNRGPPRGDNRGPPRGDNRGPPRGDNRGPPRGDNRGPPRDGPVTEGEARPADPRLARDQRTWKDRKAQDALERRAKREHQWEQSLRWRGRVPELQAAGKSDQYEAIRGWVMKLRLDNSQITDAAVRFHYPLYDGSIAHLTVEPDVQVRLAAGDAGVVAFIGYNGREHAAVPADVARDVGILQPPWLRHMIGITDQPGWSPIVIEAEEPVKTDPSTTDIAAIDAAAATEVEPPSES
jgi:uncharacterized protein YaiL (DUF2058 family)